MRFSRDQPCEVQSSVQKENTLIVFVTQCLINYGLFGSFFSLG